MLKLPGKTRWGQIVLQCLGENKFNLQKLAVEEKVNKYIIKLTKIVYYAPREQK